MNLELTDDQRMMQDAFASADLEQARNVERMANSALMLNPDDAGTIRRYVEGIGNPSLESATAVASLSLTAQDVPTAMTKAHAEG